MSKSLKNYITIKVPCLCVLRGRSCQSCPKSMRTVESGVPVCPCHLFPATVLPWPLPPAPRPAVCQPCLSRRVPRAAPLPSTALPYVVAPGWCPPDPMSPASLLLRACLVFAGLQEATTGCLPDQPGNAGWWRWHRDCDRVVATSTAGLITPHLWTCL